MKKLSILLFLLFAFCILLSTFYVFSTNINPASPIYFLVSVKEMVELQFARTFQAKAERQLEFANRRISEVKSLSDTSHQDLIEPTLEKYAWHLRELKGSVYPKDEVMMSKVNRSIIAQLTVLQEVFAKVTDPSAKRSTRLAIFRISEKFDVSKPTACIFLSKEALSSALSEVEKFVYKERATKCLQVNQ